MTKPGELGFTQGGDDRDFPTGVEPKTLQKLAAMPGPDERGHIEWLAVTLTNKKDKALAAAYMRRASYEALLDEVLGPDHWQTRFEVVGGQVICHLGVFVRGAGWLWRGEGAPLPAPKSPPGGKPSQDAGKGRNSEPEKGAFTGAFKRACRAWGLGRNLRALGQPWHPCETYTGSDNKVRFKEWKGDPGDQVFRPADGDQPRPVAPAGGGQPPQSGPGLEEMRAAIRDELLKRAKNDASQAKAALRKLSGKDTVAEMAEGQVRAVWRNLFGGGK